MILAIDHIGIVVQDLERAARFLQQAGGFVPLQEHPLLGLHQHALQSRLLDAPRCRIELLIYHDPSVLQYRPVNEAGITHVCVQTDQIGPLYQSFADAGANFHAAPVQLATGNMYCYARDPEAHVIELEALPNAPANRPPWVAHVGLASADGDRLASFYHTILGGTRAGDRMIGPNPLIDAITSLHDVQVIPTWIMGRNIAIEVMQFLRPPTLSQAAPRRFTALGYNHICLTVQNLAAALAMIQEAGGSDATAIQYTQGTASALVRDPDGNWLELVELVS